jgi:hypothetical protein
MQSCLLGGVKHGHGTAASGNHLSIRKADPLAAVLIKKLIANSPICCLVLEPVGMDLPGNLCGKLVGNTLHVKPRTCSSSFSTGHLSRFLAIRTPAQS